MSGEPRDGVFRGAEHELDVFSMDIGGTEFQLSRIDGVNVVIPKDLKDGVMTQLQLEKATTLAAEKASELSYKNKYDLYAVAAGIVSYGKYKPEYKGGMKTSYRAKKDEYFGGYCIYVNGRKSMHTFKTEAQAKKEALKRAENFDGHKSIDIFVAKVWYNNIHHSVSHYVTVGRVNLVKVGEVKSKPKNKPKSFKVYPIYEWAWDVVLIDHEYEYM